jgi:hypothetical protein
VNLTLPESIEARLSPESMALHLAIGLFDDIVNAALATVGE